MQIAVDHDIAMGPAVHFDEIHDDPHLVRARWSSPSITRCSATSSRSATRSSCPASTFTVRSAPAHGEHTDEILAELGYDDAARDDLRAAGII